MKNLVTTTAFSTFASFSFSLAAGKSVLMPFALAFATSLRQLLLGFVFPFALAFALCRRLVVGGGGTVCVSCAVVVSLFVGFAC